jgi:hypothetical protein
MNKAYALADLNSYFLRLKVLTISYVLIAFHKKNATNNLPRPFSAQLLLSFNGNFKIFLMLAPFAAMLYNVSISS